MAVDDANPPDEFFTATRRGLTIELSFRGRRLAVGHGARNRRRAQAARRWSCALGEGILRIEIDYRRYDRTTDRKTDRGDGSAIARFAGASGLELDQLDRTINARRRLKNRSGAGTLPFCFETSAPFSGAAQARRRFAENQSS